MKVSGFQIVLLALAVELVSSCCRAGGLWSEWEGNTAECPDTCGGVGTYVRRRTCISAASECPCDGAAQDTHPCHLTPCIYPRNMTCLPPRAMGVLNGKFACKLSSEVDDTLTTPKSTCAECCPEEGIWSEWVASGYCSDTCGAFGTVKRVRTCLSDSYTCPCKGSTEEQMPCNIIPCTNGTECATSTVKQYNPDNGVYECRPITPVIPPPSKFTTCCDPEQVGLWNQWTSWSTCNSTCGMCGKRLRSRTCASQIYGCPCVGEHMQQESCASMQCTTGTACCAPATAAIGFDGNKICSLNPSAIPATVTTTTMKTTTTTKTTTKPATGTWSEWAAASGAQCSDTCGSCGKINAVRTCLPAGAICVGSSTGTIACAPEVCATPRASCCTGFTRTFDAVLRMFVCKADAV